jgi:hypothetical protein
MTSGPTHEDPPSPEYTPGGGAVPDTHGPSEAWATLSGTGRSDAEGTEADDTQIPPAPRRRARIWPRVVGVLILLLGVGGAWIWQNPGFVQNRLNSLFPGTARRDAEGSALDALQARVARLEQQPSTADLAARLDTLEKRGQATGQGTLQPSVDLRPLLARLDALEARSRTTGTGTAPAGATNSADVAQLVARLNALEKTVAERGTDPARIDALSGQVEALSTRDPAAKLRDKLDQLAQQVSGLAASETKVAQDSDNAVRLARFGAAQIALEAGQPVGAIPDAPPALARFATAAPPTEAALRLDFPAASQAALKVSQPDTADKPFLDRVMARLQDSKLITVREGDRVVIGNSVAATLERAQALLDAGDLGGAVKVVATLTGPPKEKMAAWLADAASLQEAREALASLAGKG